MANDEQTEEEEKITINSSGNGGKWFMTGKDDLVEEEKPARENKHLDKKKIPFSWLVIIVQLLIILLLVMFIVLLQPKTIEGLSKLRQLWSRPAPVLSLPVDQLLLKKEIDLAHQALYLTTETNESMLALNRTANDFGSWANKHLAEKKKPWSDPVIEAHKEINLALENYQQGLIPVKVRLKHTTALYNDLAQSIKKQTDLKELNLPEKI